MIAITLILTHITIVAVTVYLHRHSAHRAVELHPVLKHFFRFWLWMTTGMNTKEWTAIHRKHHATCETAEDPHSPQVQGIRKIFWQGAEVYRAAAVPETLERYGAGCPDDWMERNVYSRFTVLGVSLMLIINVALFGALGLTVWAVQMMWIPVTAAGVINGIGHYWGYRNFECHDAARNIVPWGIVIGGEELHNNHHTYPNSAKLSQKPWEFDIGWMYIRIFEMLGLAKARSTGPVVAQVPGKSTLDTDTAWAVLNDRFRVMAKYSKTVVGPLVEQELTRAGNVRRSVVRATRRILCRDDSLVDDQGKHQINEILDASPRLQTIYEFKQRLQGVWAKRSAGAEELLSELKQWCVDAEATGIQALKDFVEEIRSYSM
ncbi:MAG: fatty acid desaturase, partial [Pseudomonadales bacterium]